MKIYISGIGGVAMGPLAMIARDMGHEVIGSNDVDSDLVQSMINDGFSVNIGQHDGYIKSVHEKEPIEWFIYTSALPKSHPELIYAEQNGIKTSKRDEFINSLLDERDLKMLAISGTHGKTNTTGMMVWCLMQAGIPISYSVGSKISFGPFGKYKQDSEYFVYEADEFDRNMLNYEPAVSLITNIDFDHPDTYSSREDYNDAFVQFIDNSQVTYLYDEDAERIEAASSPGVHCIDKDPNESSTTIPGLYIRQNARLVIEVLTHQFGLTDEEAVTYINGYPGTSRRMEKLADNLYTDYAHHPNEIRSVIQQASELSDDVVVLYQPHQNIRQHEIKDSYKDCFKGASRVYWLPTYMSRESKSELDILTQSELIKALDDAELAEPAEMDKEMIEKVATSITNGSLVLCLSAGNLDEWARSKLVK